MRDLILDFKCFSLYITLLFVPVYKVGTLGLGFFNGLKRINMPISHAGTHRPCSGPFQVHMS